ncbi:hypothetical protein [Agromyces seonyuensis]|uniref:Modulator of FtsH protease n=1 Tax=Agromyces seonyuensis TaxID=2662446 RepID=A0A6I4NX41_9MICO|nr:hypothetical protein [Agromyces seonyuensis]MWB98751.1 hypothetical protein [Agromyces seonyuensis]
MGAELEAWSEFNVAMAGATAALAGLIIVAMSVNIDRIVKAPAIAARGATAIAALVLAVLVCALGLVPEQPAVVFGLEILVLSLLALAVAVPAARRIVVAGGPRAWIVPKILIAAAPALLYLAAGVLVVAGAAGAGLAAAAIGCFLAIISGTLFGWVALVELLR